jgi:hypothetical protein
VNETKLGLVSFWMLPQPLTCCCTVLPFTHSNVLKKKAFSLWLKGRRAIESLEEQKRTYNDSSPIDLVDCPSSFDVVFKTGTSNTGHPGNVAFQEQLFAVLDTFTSASSSREKQAICRSLKEVVERKGRFLEWDSCCCWRVLKDDEKIRSKIYNSLVYMKKSSSAAKCRQSNSSSTYLFERQDGRKRKRAEDGSEAAMCGSFCRPICT